MVEAIAVDMDGTFLKDDGTYDQERFKDLYQKMKEKDIKFIVASGNQYAQLKTFFPEINKEIYFIAENGALIYQDDQLIKKEYFEKPMIKKILAFLNETYPEIHTILCGLNQAYIKKDTPEEFKEIARTYYYKLKEVDNLWTLEEEEYVKFALAVPKERMESIRKHLLKKFEGKAQIVSSGHGSVDIIIPGSHKASSLEYLMKEWEISAQDLLAFGDGDNDAEMLQLAGHSYGMANGSPLIKKITTNTAPENNQSGVLKVMEQYLKDSNESF